MHHNNQTRLTRKCPFQCSKLISPDYFACPFHWRKVGEKHKHSILVAWDRYKRASDQQEGLAALRALEAAQKAALEDVK